MMQKIKLFFTNLFNFILLSTVYFLGIGLTAVFSRIFNKKFLSSELPKSKKSNFIVFTSRSNLEKMF